MVTRTGDSGAGTLRGEILAARNGDTIDFSSRLNGKTITLTSHNEILINSNITIHGPGSGNLSVSGSDSRLFEIAAGADVTISGLTRKNGNGTGNNITAEGGAILNHGALTLTGDILKDNNASILAGEAEPAAQGGAVYFAQDSQGALTNVAITSNHASGAPGGAAQGGGLFATGADVSVSLCTVSNNGADGGNASSRGVNGGDGQGGSFYVQGGTLVITDSTVAGNFSRGGYGGMGTTGGTGRTGTGGTGGNGQGGGLFVAPGGDVTINVTADTFYKNEADGGSGGDAGFGISAGTSGSGGSAEGGAVAVDATSTSATVNLTNDTFAANVATGGDGGVALDKDGSGGSAEGGAVWANGGAIALLNDTIAGSSSGFASDPAAGNSARGGFGDGNGTGVGGGLFDAGGTFMTLRNTIVANNGVNGTANAPPTHSDVAGSFTAQDHNLIGTTTGSSGFGGTDLGGMDPQLSALGGFGGPTMTMMPVGGPAIDGGDSAVAPADDQRGITRPQGSSVDIGAVEVDNHNGPLPGVLTVTNNHDTGPGSLRAEILAAQNGDTIEFASKLKGTTIDLSSHNEILIDKNITIQGPGSGKLAVSGKGSRLFEIIPDATVMISGLSLKGGNGTGNGLAGEGGAILNHGSLTLTDDTITDNTTKEKFAPSQGGGLFC